MEAYKVTRGKLDGKTGRIPMINVKYYAGLFDSDGSFDFRANKRDNGNYYLDVKAVLYQKDVRPLIPLARRFNVPIREGKGCSYVTLQGNKALNLMELIKNHLVVKKQVVDYLISIKGKTVEDIETVRETVKLKRKEAAPEKNYPSRAWMAGYIDGDGCLHSSFRKKDGNLEFKLTVVSHLTQRAGIDLLHKAFKGYVTTQGDCVRWSLSLSVTKGKQVLNFFSQHLVMKKDQAYLILECLETRKHFRQKGASYEGNLELHKHLQGLKVPTTTEPQNTQQCEVTV